MIARHLRCGPAWRRRLSDDAQLVVPAPAPPSLDDLITSTFAIVLCLLSQ